MIRTIVFFHLTALPPEEPFPNFRAFKSDDFYAVQERRVTDFKAPKLSEGALVEPKPKYKNIV